MSVSNFSYTDIYDAYLITKQRFREAIPADKITPETRQLWNLEDQKEPMKRRYYQQLDEKRLAMMDKEDALYEIKFKSEVKVK